ncbi:cytidylyltransferase domain-containing protein [Sporosarcina newyorkensis]|uniref:acylneuraminate cytidylyltransferase family protein n=1 Tax=Sporosarcina newyorkensis TaxID=759851 RepID=UPI003D02B438
MYNNKKFLAVVPARGGSKGIPRKNIYAVQDKPLIAYSIEEAKKSRYIDRVIVSTDDLEIAEVSIECGAEVPFLRPTELATDDAKIIDVLLHLINTVQENYDYVVTLQPTQPLRVASHIDRSIERLFEKEYSDLVSLSPISEHPILIRSIDENGNLHSLLNQDSTVRRQNFAPYYYVNGAIYINKVSELDKYTSLNDNKGYYVIKENLIDIDDFDDINWLEKFLEKNEMEQ